MSDADPVNLFLASVVAEASEAHEPAWDRLALLASDLLGKVTAARSGYGWAAANYGYPGPAALTSPARQQSIAGDVLGRAQASLDSDNPDVRSAAAGLGAARRLIAAGKRDASMDVAQWISYVSLGLDPLTQPGSPWYQGHGNLGPGPLAPARLIDQEGE
jgi:hypothetical protein